VNKVGYQTISFPGQVISTDSFSLSLSEQRMTLVVMKQCDFSDSKLARNAPISAPLSAWMLVSSAFHTPNITIIGYINMWRQAKPSLISTEWKSLVASEAQLLEFEMHYDALQIAPILESLASRNFHFTSPTMTLMKAQQLDDHGFKSVKYAKNEETQLQTTTVDAYQHEAIWQYLKHPSDMNPTKILAAATNPTLEEVQRDLGTKFDLDLSRQAELMELASL